MATKYPATSKTMSSSLETYNNEMNIQMAGYKKYKCNGHIMSLISENFPREYGLKRREKKYK
jgi:hypothetical protein